MNNRFILDYYKAQIIEEEDQANDTTWVAHSKGDWGQEYFEIYVIRQNNSHGFKSYGWFDPDIKRLITHNGGPCNWPIDNQHTWDLLIQVARTVANKLNNEEKVE